MSQLHTIGEGFVATCIDRRLSRPFWGRFWGGKSPWAAAGVGAHQFSAEVGAFAFLLNPGMKEY